MLGLALLVVAGTAVVRSNGDPAPGPTPPASSVSAGGSSPPPSPGWPVDIGLEPGTVWLVARDGITGIDSSSGFVRHQDVDVDPSTTHLTPMSLGVLAWSTDGGPTQLVGVAGTGSTRPVGPARSAERVLPGPDETVWVAGRPSRGRVATTSWVQADGERATGPRVRVPGSAVGDGSGGLFGVAGRTVRHLYPGAPQDLGTGSVLAVGQDGWVVDRCFGGTCTAELHERSGQVSTVATAAAPNPQQPVDPAAPGSLSGRNRFVAETVPTDVADQVRVSRVGPTPQVLRTFPAGSHGGASAWLSDRWLLASSGERLVLYDAASDTLLTPHLDLEAGTELVFRPV